jgi:hypothetical protein
VSPRGAGVRETSIAEPMTSHPSPDEEPAARALRGALFTDLDRLAFALEREAAELLDAGREDDAARQQYVRLGVRLAQRLVAGVWADEVQPRVQRWEAEYEQRLAIAEPA